MFKELETIAIPLGEFDGLEVVEKNIEVVKLVNQIKQVDEEIKNSIRTNIARLAEPDINDSLIKKSITANNLRSKLFKFGRSLIEANKEIEKDKICLQDMRLEDLRLKIKEIKESLNCSTHIPVYKMKKEDMIEWLEVAMWEELGLEKPLDDVFKKYLK